MAGSDKLVGVIGGMGPSATVDFMSLVLRATPADEDQDHVRMLVEHNPGVPSRQLAISGGGENPGPVIASMASRLEAAGVDFLVMPCNTAHAWQSDILAATSIPFISIVDESVASAMSRSDDNSAIGLMATPGCFAAGLYQDAIGANNRPVITQTDEEMAATINLVDSIKSGDTSAEVSDGLRALADALINRGARIIIAACTEIPLVLDASMFDVAFVSTTNVLATKTVALARGDIPLN